jgi:hypothetical protein
MYACRAPDFAAIALFLLALRELTRSDFVIEVCVRIYLKSFRVINHIL